MIERKEIPLKFYVFFLIPVLIASFYLSGLFTFPDLSMDTAAGHLGEILREFYHPARWANAKTPACLGLGFIGWVLMSAYIMYRYRNFQTGKEYGNEDWADVFEVNKRRRDPDPAKNRILSRNLEISLYGDAKLSNNNMLVIGSSGT